MADHKKTVVIAFGGNAITPEKGKGNFQEQLDNIRKACRALVDPIKRGYRMVITHGNGPQVGFALIKNEMAKDVLPPLPLDACGANTQGVLGYAVQQQLINVLNQALVKREVAALITQTKVDLNDEAFSNPTKPIGPFYSEEQAKKMMEENPNVVMKEDSGRGWRRVVPSPKPIEIIGVKAIKELVKNDFIVIALGGGGIPVVEENGQLRGVEAVIDKDRASQRLAADLKADYLVLLTGVPKVYLNFGTPQQKPLDRITVSEARKYIEDGCFAAGSMLPKIEASVEFVEESGGKAIITDFENISDALREQAGTIIVED
ncbi:MAG TPA: carbamate kinase [Peptococcaceae bacterium]|nr:MAG: Carbamate kinase [Clostridia bacterium 41_269]HBT20710.1 carbamate kinase [Peptococcaceae bacterium]